MFGVCGGDYTVVCKHMDYRFLRPSFGPVMYKIATREKLEDLLATGEEFNITLDLDVRQQIKRKTNGRKELRVGRCTVTYHVTPKSHHKAKRHRRKRR